MKITIESSVWGGSVITDNDGVRIPCPKASDVMREVKIFLTGIKAKTKTK